MATIITSTNHGYVRTSSGRRGECGCHFCRAVRKDKVLHRKKFIEFQTEKQLGSRREISKELMLSS